MDKSQLFNVYNQISTKTFSDKNQSTITFEAKPKSILYRQDIESF